MRSTLKSRLAVASLMAAVVAAGHATGNPLFRPRPERDPLPSEDEQERRIAAAEEKRKRKAAKRALFANAYARKD